MLMLLMNLLIAWVLCGVFAFAILMPIAVKNHGWRRTIFSWTAVGALLVFAALGPLVLLVAVVRWGEIIAGDE